MQSSSKSAKTFHFLLLLYRYLVVILLLIAGLPSKSQPNEVNRFVLSDRIGLEIDSVEAEYFNLFPDLDGVKSAVYRKDNLENLQVLVSLANGSDTTIIFSKLATEELKKYIDKHEILRDSVRVVNWGLLPDYGLSKLNYFEDHGSVLFVHLLDNTVQAGRLMKITEKGLVLWQGKQPTRPNIFPQLMKPVLWSEITKIERKQDITGRIFGISMGVGLGIAAANILLGSFTFDTQDVNYSLLAIGGGALVGATLGFLYDISTISRRKYHFNSTDFNLNKLKSKLGKRAIFNAIYPPELKPVIEKLH